MEILDEAALVTKGPLFQRTQTTFAMLQAKFQATDIDWSLYIIESDHSRASAFPDGAIVISSDFIDRFSIDEVAAILSHEMAHVILKHRREWLSQWRISRQEAIELRMTMEFEADDIGTLYMSRAGFDPRASISLWLEVAKIRSEAEAKGNILSLDTHPDDDKRIKRLEAKMDVYLSEYRQKLTE